MVNDHTRLICWQEQISKIFTYNICICFIKQLMKNTVSNLFRVLLLYKTNEQTKVWNQNVVPGVLSVKQPPSTPFVFLCVQCGTQCSIRSNKLSLKTIMQSHYILLINIFADAVQLSMKVIFWETEFLEQLNLLCSLLPFSPLFSMADLTPIKMTHRREKENKLCPTRARFRHFANVYAFMHIASLCVCAQCNLTLC